MVVLGFNSSDDPDMAREFMEECGFSFRTVLDSSQAAITTAFSDYKACCVPLHYVIDRKRRVVLAQPGFEKGYRTILGTLTWLGVETGVAPLEPQFKSRRSETGKPAAFAGPVVRGKSLIRGVLSGSRNEPLARITVRLACSDPKVSKKTTTDDEGRFWFRRLPGGRYTLTVDLDPLDKTGMIEKEVLVKENQTVVVALTSK